MAFNTLRYIAPTWTGEATLAYLNKMEIPDFITR